MESTSPPRKKLKSSSRDAILPMPDHDTIHQVSCKDLHSKSSVPLPFRNVDVRKSLKWESITGENLNLRYAIVFDKPVADELFAILEAEVDYYSDDLTKVFVYGKWHSIPMKRVAYGDEGLTYKFSGSSIAARPWLPVLFHLRDILESLTGHQYNFVLINRYKDGDDHIGEHRDDEKELCKSTPIASLSLGQPRDFVFRHADSRQGPRAEHRQAPVTILLAHGSLLLMNPPTNTFWYHSLPVRKRCLRPRINLTFRKVVPLKMP